MEIILIILTSTILSACFLLAYKFGYDKAKNEKPSQDVEVSKENRKMLQEYANLMSYTGQERD